ncbi:hypothetical protein JCM12681A_02920 [Streptomyces mexicanus]
MGYSHNPRPFRDFAKIHPDEPKSVGRVIPVNLPIQVREARDGRSVFVARLGPAQDAESRSQASIHEVCA